MRYPASEKVESEPSRRHAFETDGEPARGAVPPAGPPDPGEARRPAGDLSHAGTSSTGPGDPKPSRTASPGPAAQEPPPRRGPGEGGRAGPGPARAVAPRAGRAVHRRGAALRPRGHGVPPGSRAHDLITSPAHVVVKAASEFRDKTTAPNELRSERLHPPEGHRLGVVLRSRARAWPTSGARLGTEPPRVSRRRFRLVLRRHRGHLQLLVVARLGLGGRDMTDGREQATVVEPVHPFAAARGPSVRGWRTPRPRGCATGCGAG